MEIGLRATALLGRPLAVLRLCYWGIFGAVLESAHALALAREEGEEREFRAVVVYSGLQAVGLLALDFWAEMLGRGALWSSGLAVIALYLALLAVNYRAVLIRGGWRAFKARLRPVSPGRQRLARVLGRVGYLFLIAFAAYTLHRYIRWGIAGRPAGG